MPTENKNVSLTPQALKVLEVIIHNNITVIDYKHPEKTLGRFIEDELPDYSGLLKQISEVGSGVLNARVGFTVPFVGWEFGVSYLVDVDRAKSLYEEQAGRLYQEQTAKISK